MRGPHFDRFDEPHAWHAEEIAKEGGQQIEPNRKWWVAAAVVSALIHLAACVAIAIIYARN